MIKPRRFWVLGLASVVSFAFIIARLAYLQLYCHAALYQRAEKERAQHFEVTSRGAIFDRSGQVLAMSIQGGSCFADPHRITNPTETARTLSPLLNISADSLRAKLVERKRFVWLARRLDPDQTQKLQALHCPGVTVVSDMKRFYPEESLASQVLGVVGQEQNGLSGVEQMADAWLSGRSTPFLFSQWTFSKERSAHWSSKTEVSPNGVVLTIDRTLQTIVEQELATQMALSRPKSGTVIIEDPKTGEILAMATAPSFNPNIWGTPAAPDDYGPDLLKNPAVEKVVEPGSTFKLVTASAALEQHVVQPSDGFNCENGVWQTQGRTIHDHERDGWMTFTEIISHSSNIGTAKVALRLGADNLYRYARAFGFGMPTGCGLPGDGTGILRTPHEWRNGSLCTIAFGQEVGATMLQVVNAYAVIANGGELLEPRLYKGITDENGMYHEWESGKPIRRVVSGRTVGIMRMILKDVVEHGTGQSAKVAGLSIAGKTGTAQKIDPLTHQYSPDHYFASFCGFAPAESPRLVIGVFLDEPKGSYWGGSEAAPLFARIIRDAAPYLQLQQVPLGPIAVTRMGTQS